MSFVQTIQGNIDPKEIGVFNSHEHLDRNSGDKVALRGDGHRLPFVDKSVEEVKRCIHFGGKTMVNANPIGLKSDIIKDFALRLDRKSFSEPIIESIVVNNLARLFVFNR